MKRGGTRLNALLLAATLGLAGANSARANVSTNAHPIGAGPGGPIVVIGDVANPFSYYFIEILLAEGLNAFRTLDVSSLTNGALAPYDVAVLGRAALTPGQVAVLSNWVETGGNLIAMRPDKQLTNLLGIADANAAVSEGYLRINTSNAPGAGIVSETIQFHGTADRYTLNGASSLATLYADTVTPLPNPAVTLRSVGSDGGQAAAFTFDLARSIVLTRQGNPAWAGQERDGIPPLRSSDLFFGNAAGDPQPDWVDLNKIAIPQADEQQRFLANLIAFMNSDRRLLPRFWYFPFGHKAAVVMTGDDHANGATAAHFENFIRYSPPGGSVEQWETVRASSYIYPGTPLSNAQLAAYQAQGFEVALHLNGGCSNYTLPQITAMFSSQLAQMSNAFPSLARTRTHRIHCIAWSGYSILAEAQASLGIRLDLNYYHYPASWLAHRSGFLTGSGIPMRFTTEQGNILDVFQAATQMTDESGQSYPYTVNTLLDRALGPQGFYGAFVANMHTDFTNHPAADFVVRSAQQRGVPVISGRQLLDWVDGRNSSWFENIQWSGNTLSFSVHTNAQARGLQLMVPVPAGLRISGITRNGNAMTYQLRGMAGVQYAFVPAPAGEFVIHFIPDTSAPQVVSVSPTNGATEVELRTEIRLTFGEAMDVSTINSNTVLLHDAYSNFIPATVLYDVPNLRAVLVPNTPLVRARGYTIVVKSGVAGVKDVSGNALASDFTASFNTASQFASSIWKGISIPDSFTVTETNAVELGVKFRSAVAGFITGIRFHKAPGNTGTHIGNLWTANGTLLGSVTFNGESALGWQSQTFHTPIPIQSNTTYVASYHAPRGRFSLAPGYFGSAGVTNYPLSALRNGEQGGNGVYRYSSTSTFPNASFNSANYWVDVMFIAVPSKFHSIARLTDGRVQLRGQGDVGVVYRVQASSDLSMWQEIGTVLCDENGQLFFESPVANQPIQFYRWLLP